MTGATERSWISARDAEQIKFVDLPLIELNLDRLNQSLESARKRQRKAIAGAIKQKNSEIESVRIPLQESALLVRAGKAMKKKDRPAAGITRFLDVKTADARLWIRLPREGVYCLFLECLEDIRSL